MAQQTDSRRGEIQRAFMEVLRENPDGIQAKDVIATVASRLTLSELEKSEYPNRPGIRQFDKILRFLTIGPVKAGWMTKEKGIWTINAAGDGALTQFKKPADLFTESRRLYMVWKKDQPDEPADGVEEDKPDSTTLEEAEEVAWIEIREFLAVMNESMKNMGVHLTVGLHLHYR